MTVNCGFSGINQTRLPDAIRSFFFFFCLFLFSLTSLSRLFHTYRDEPIGRWGETGVPRENHLTHPQAEHGLFHVWPVRGSKSCTKSDLKKNCKCN